MRDFGYTTTPPRKCDNAPECDWPVWHICLLGKEDRFPELLRQQQKKVKKGVRRPNNGPRAPRTELHIENLRAAQRERWALIKEKNRPRDEKIIARYEEGVGLVTMKEIATEFRVSRSTVVKIIKDAKAEGHLEGLKPGYSPLALEAKRIRNETIAKQYLSGGVSLLDLQNEHNISLRTVKRILAEENVAVRAQGWTLARGAR